MTDSLKSNPTRPQRIVLIALGCLLLSVLFFAPRLWLMRVVVPGSFQWDRARTYLAQCEQPFRRDIEPAMHWRILPPLAAHYLGLSGYTPLVLPWAGVCALVGYVAVLHARRLPDPRFVFGGTLLVATSSAILVPVGWLGINDAWVWLGLLAVAFGRTSWGIAAACLLCPWIDERFIIGAPLAWVARCLDEDRKFLSSGVFSACWLIPYALTRLIFGGNPLTNDTSSHFLSTQVQSAMAFLPMAPLGWWMGIRVGWIGVGYAGLNVSVARGLQAALVLGATLIVTFVLASDISRSIGIVLPLVLLGSFILARRDPKRAPQILLIAGCINLVIPAAHVVLNKIDLINPLPVEIFRLLRS